jgi:hypothetical protein
VAYFASRGALQPFLSAAFLFNVSYGGKKSICWTAFISGIKHLGFAAARAGGDAPGPEGLRTQFKPGDRSTCSGSASTSS